MHEINMTMQNNTNVVLVIGTVLTNLDGHLWQRSRNHQRSAVTGEMASQAAKKSDSFKRN